MVAGPNGSGKTTLVEFLRGELALPLGHYLNPDKLDKELAQTGRISVSRWGIAVDPDHLWKFIASHPLFVRAGIGPVSVERDTVVPAMPSPSGYFASVLSGYLRQNWLNQRATFTFETVMSRRDKLGSGSPNVRGI